MATETSPLLPERERTQAPRTGISSPSRTLKQEATRLIEYHKSSSPGDTSGVDIDFPTVPEQKLAAHLYALSTLDASSPAVTSITTRLRNTSTLLTVQAALNNAVEGILDIYGLSQLQSSEEEEDESLLDMAWTRWPIDEKTQACAMELLLPPYTRSPSPFLSHLLVRHFLSEAWSTSGPRLRTSPLKQIITPRRVNLLRLLSLLVLWLSAIYIAIKPGDWIGPYDLDDGFKLNRSEIIWTIWVISTILETLQTRSSNLHSLLILPTFFSLLIAVPGLIKNQPSPTSYTLTNLSIPFLSLHLILPIIPSIPTTIPTLLPLSVLLVVILRKTVLPGLLVLPVVLILGMGFGWAINGDIFRLFISFPTALSISFYNIVTLARCMLVVNGTRREEEQGVSPFLARLTLFSTFCLLLISSIALSISRSLSSNTVREGKRWKGGVRDEDDWERAYGVEVGRRAREVSAISVVGYIDRRSGQVVKRDGNDAEDRGTTGLSRERRMRWILPPPLNLLLLPFDLVRLVRFVVSLFALWETSGEERLDRVQDGLIDFILGSLCLVLKMLQW